MATTQLDVGLIGERVQFRPDLLPADLTAALEYRSDRGKVNSTTGPLYSNTILAAMLLPPLLYVGIWTAPRFRRRGAAMTAAAA